MKSSRYLLAFSLLPLLGLSWAAIVAIDPTWRPYWQFLSACMIGTLFGQTTLAAAWAALGPLPLLWRLPFSLAWIAALVITFVIHIKLHMGSNAAQIALIIGACLCGQWLLLQFPLWCLAAYQDVRLRHWTDPPASPRDRQFGIRQVILFTLIVAVVLGMGRWILGETAGLFSSPEDQRGIVAFTFWTIASIIITLPLLLAALLPRWAALAVAGVLTLMAAGTVVEVALLNFGTGGGASLWYFGVTNGVQAAWILAVVALVRWCGYGISQPRGENPFASKGQLASPAGKSGESLPPGQS